MKKTLLSLCFLLTLTFLISSCSVVDACFNSHLAKEGKKYNSYGKSKSGSKSLSAKRYKGGRGKSSDIKKYDNKGIEIPDYATNVGRPTETAAYSKAQLKAIARQNKRLYRQNKGGKGKFRYPYQITSPYSKKEDDKKEKTTTATQKKAITKSEKKKED